MQITDEKQFTKEEMKPLVQFFSILLEWYVEDKQKSAESQQIKSE